MNRVLEPNRSALRADRAHRQESEMNLKHDLWRAKQEREAARSALAMSSAALTLTRDDLFALAARGRLRDFQDVYRSGIAAAVIRADGGIDVDDLDRRIETLLEQHPELRSHVVGR